jgi:hypothetical protein
MTPIRVIQWATGPIGAAQLREVIDNPEFELAGVFVYDPAKIGVDAATVVGRPPTGIVTCHDKSAILALDADAVLHAASKAVAENTNTDDIVALLESAKNVITTTSYNHLPAYGHDTHRRIALACERGGTATVAKSEPLGPLPAVPYPVIVSEQRVASRQGLVAPACPETPFLGKDGVVSGGSSRRHDASRVTSISRSTASARQRIPAPQPITGV